MTDEPKEKSYRVRLEFSGIVNAYNKEHALVLAQEQANIHFELIDWSVSLIQP